MFWAVSQVQCIFKTKSNWQTITSAGNRLKLGWTDVIMATVAVGDPVIKRGGFEFLYTV